MPHELPPERPVLGQLQAVLGEVVVRIQETPGVLERGPGPQAPGRIAEGVARVPGQGKGQGAGVGDAPRLCRLPPYQGRGRVLHVLDVHSLVGVGRRAKDLLHQQVADGQREPPAALVEALVGPEPRLVFEAPDLHQDVGIQEVGVAVEGVVPVGPLPDLPRQGGALSQAEEVTLRDAGHGDGAVHGAVPATDGEGTGRFFLHVHRQIHPVPGRRPLGVQLHLLEESEVLEVAPAALLQSAVEDIPLHQAKFPADHLVPGPGIPRDLDPVDEGLAALGDLQGDVHRALGPFDIGDGRHVGEQVPPLRVAVGDGHHVALQRLPAEDASRPALDETPDLGLREQAVAFDAEITDPVLGTFLDPDEDSELLPARIELDLRLLHRDVQEPVIQVVGPDTIQVAAHLLPLQGAAEEEEVQLRGLEPALDVLLLQVPVADDPDLTHIELVPLHDVEGDGHLLRGDPVLAPLHLGLVKAFLLVKQADLLGVLGQGAGGNDGAFHQVILGLDLVHRQLPVPDDADALDAGLLVEHEGQLQAPLEDVGLNDDVFEVAQPVEGLDILAHHLGRIGIPDATLELEADGGLFDLACPDHVNLGDEGLILRPCPPGWGEEEEATAEKDGQPNA